MALDTLIEELRETFEVPGIAVGVLQDGKTVLSQGFGLRDVEQHLPVTPGTAFAIASVTKAFTAAAVAALVDDGLLEWDRPVREYIPDFQMYDHIATEAMTARDLLCHRSGLPRHDIVWYRNKTLTRADIVARLRYLKPNKSFRSTWQYNNLMYVTAGYLCEVVTGETWEELVRRRLLERMSMTATSFSFEDSGVDGQVSLPYGKRKGEVVQIPYERSLRVSGPAGSIHSTLTDMMQWVRVNLDDGKLGDEQVLSPEAVRQLRAPHMVMPPGRIFPEVYDQAYALGWFIGSYRGRRYVHHGGNTDGFTSLVAMLPDEGIGAVILSNRQATLSREAIAFGVFDELLGLDPLPWGKRLKEREDAMNEGMKEAKSRASRVDGTAPGHPLEDYAGTYEHPAYGSFVVDLVDGQLKPSFRELSIEMRHRHFEVFDVELEDYEDSQLTATFSTGVDGAIESVTLPLEPFVEPIVMKRVPDPMPAREVCEQLARSYFMGPVEIAIEFTPPDRLSVRIPGAERGTFALLAHRGLRFKVEGMDPASAEFILDESGEPIELVLQPVGVLRPNRPSNGE